MVYFGMENNDWRWIFLGLLLLTAAGGIWLFRDALFPAAAPVAAPPPAGQTRAEPAGPALEPVYPVAPIEKRTAGGKLVPLPPLDESDAYFELALLELFGPELKEQLVSELLIERTVGTLDNLGRERVPERMRPVGRLGDGFEVDGTGGDAGYMISERNYVRYDDAVRMLERASAEELTDTYRRFYPLLQEAYTLLGYPERHFNDRLVAVIDTLLATPEPAGPVELVRDHVLYEYRDPELAALTAGQKLLIRMGNDNARRVKAVLRAWREQITELEP
ncbi:MAG: DUF3014 domain-containing protein [Pseudomonadota bacterium]